MSDQSERFFIDGNGVLTERTSVGGTEVLVHYDDLPPGDVTEVGGIPVTTPLRTVIDLAVDVDDDHLREMVEDCLARRLFTLEEALIRTSEPDMVARKGAQRLRACLRGDLRSDPDTR